MLGLTHYTNYPIYKDRHTSNSMNSYYDSAATASSCSDDRSEAHSLSEGMCTCDELFVANFWEDSDESSVICENCIIKQAQNDIVAIDMKHKKATKTNNKSHEKHNSSDIHGLFVAGYNENSDCESDNFMEIQQPVDDKGKIDDPNMKSYNSINPKVNYDSLCAIDLNAFLGMSDINDINYEMALSENEENKIDCDENCSSDSEKEESDNDQSDTEESGSETENECSDNQVVPDASDSEKKENDSDNDSDQSDEEDAETHGPEYYMKCYQTSSETCVRTNSIHYDTRNQTRNGGRNVFECDSVEFFTGSGKLKVTRIYRFPRLMPTEIEEIVAFWELDFQVGNYIVPKMASWEGKGLNPSQDSQLSDYLKYNGYKSLYCKWVKCNKSLDQWYSKYGYMSLYSILNSQVQGVKRKSLALVSSLKSGDTQLLQSPREKTRQKKRRRDH